jgi:hypothetical protein
MSKRKTDHETGGICSRRAFLAATGAAAAGLAAGSLAKPGRLFAAAPSRSYGVPALVAATQAFDYTRENVKARVQHLFEALGGIGDVIKSGDKVAIRSISPAGLRMKATPGSRVRLSSKVCGRTRRCCARWEN